jgi:hypothetical protein
MRAANLVRPTEEPGGEPGALAETAATSKTGSDTTPEPGPATGAEARTAPPETVRPPKNAGPKPNGGARKGGNGKRAAASKPQDTAKARPEATTPVVQSVQKKAPRRGIRLKIDDGTGEDDR